MQFTSVLAILAAAVAAAAQSLDSSQMDFLTKLVDDVRGNQNQYMKYIKTGGDYPKDFTSLAMQVRTYKDDSYTTLLKSESINMGELSSFVGKLPWADRVEGSGSGSSASETGSKGSSSSSSSSSAKSSSSSKADAAAVLAPAGLSFAALVAALL
ncbi:Piso0_002910 [Millerozyma farinosa CBS 7064]|uniref:Piso0_002910 protein n=1 Tax=Pichia sorbitophila (strain ATCC MYA-4447 / BCRC 22081 / CBS 7064 / NBRC 10061 / NRRL Y-12695) TaxID=559304 RepID=G8YJT9_PICSO|nr:Piso0_002910 [Millerozyma farinosa CBS 7064]CCE80584.1 Piso0_002910 [Millerozyma farinosa CBS 7064]